MLAAFSSKLRTLTGQRSDIASTDHLKKKMVLPAPHNSRPHVRGQLHIRGQPSSDRDRGTPIPILSHTHLFAHSDLERTD